MASTDMTAGPAQVLDLGTARNAAFVQAAGAVLDQMYGYWVYVPLRQAHTIHADAA